MCLTRLVSLKGLTNLDFFVFGRSLRTHTCFLCFKMKTMKQQLRNLMEGCIPAMKKQKGNGKVCLKTQWLIFNFLDAEAESLNLEDTRVDK